MACIHTWLKTVIYAERFPEVTNGPTWFCSKSDPIGSALFGMSQSTPREALGSDGYMESEAKSGWLFTRDQSCRSQRVPRVVSRLLLWMAFVAILSVCVAYLRVLVRNYKLSQQTALYEQQLPLW